ncbi:glycosyltransferase family 4 protein [Microbacterium telephonicum]|uniref:glycosyltransferase family 4 protein n=1 Tax=Microbacterium telephonicum TaxID=1714841 RepID=UPI001314CC24|nr:glycosyltransferase family 4 protein [Microbacterium telephonicum]
MPLGIDTEYYAQTPYPDSRLVLSVGNDQARDSRTLYGSFEELLSMDPSIEIVVQTKDPQLPPRGVTKVTRFSDHSELRNYYQRAAVIVVASRPNLYTSGSTVALEAQAIGRPVVISDTPGMSDYVHDRETGVLTPPEDAMAMASAVKSLLDAPEKAADMGLSGARAVRAGNASEQMIGQIAEILHGLPPR